MELNQKPWLYEIEGIREQNNTFLTPFQIVSRNIRSSDLVVTYYKQRVGSMFENNNLIPFYATDFEINEAIKNDIPIKLYIIGSNHTIRLKGILSLYTNPLINIETVYCINEEEAIENTIKDLKSENKILLYNSIATPNNIEFKVDKIGNWLCEFRQELIKYVSQGNYKLAYLKTSQNPYFDNIKPKSKEEKFLKGQCLAICANIFANISKYNVAIEFAFKSIRLFMEIGDLINMFRQIQALSGIQNMASNNSARWINSYGFRSIKIYNEISMEYRDSRASILRDMGRYKEGLLLLEENSDWEKSPYSAAKYAHMLGHSKKTNCISTSRKLIEYEILPWARNENKNLPYVLREAGILAILDNDIYSANLYFTESEKICLSMGNIHTLNTIYGYKKSST